MPDCVISIYDVFMHSHMQNGDYVGAKEQYLAAIQVVKDLNDRSGFYWPYKVLQLTTTHPHVHQSVARAWPTCTSAPTSWTSPSNTSRLACVDACIHGLTHVGRLHTR